MPILSLYEASAPSAARMQRARGLSARCACSQLLPPTLLTGNSFFWILTISFCSKKILALLISGTDRDPLLPSGRRSPRGIFQGFDVSGLCLIALVCSLALSLLS